MRSWFVVNTLPNQEKRAEINLLRQGFKAWLPSIAKSRRHARRTDTIQAPIFPSYLFVELDMEKEAWGKINNSFGVKKILSNGEKPQKLSSEFVETLRQTICSDDSFYREIDSPKRGDKVRITDGPFGEYIAKVIDLMPGDRVKVLLDVLGGSVKTSVPLKSVSTAI